MGNAQNVVEKTEMTRDLIEARTLASKGAVRQARQLLAKYDVRHVVIEIVPGESRKGEVK